MPKPKSRPAFAPEYYYLGIDPGKEGGVAVIGPDGTVAVDPLPESHQDRLLILEGLSLADHLWACIEQIDPRPTNVFDRKANAFRGTILKSTCLLYGDYCALCMALTAARIPYEAHPPIRWQKGLHLSPREKGETDRQWKKRLLARAQQLFPRAPVTLQTADAVLLAEYGRRVHQGKE